ncbi:MAG: DNA repair protein RadC [Clostridia bacterium]|nr:DNA repair protein RadC [Clostridia bacterium]
MGVHDGHRNRLRERFLKEGLDNFEPHEVLELFLYYSIPYKDTNPIAHKLLDEFGTLSGVFAADSSDLMKVDGISSNSAVLLKMIPHLCRYYRKDYVTPRVKLNSVGAVRKFLYALLVDEPAEVLYMVCLDTRDQLIRPIIINRGTVNQVNVHLREIHAKVLQSGAVSIVLGHNHPSRQSKPSTDDIRLTEKIVKSLAYLDVNVYDHIIVGGEDTFSFGEAGLLDQCRRDCPKQFIERFAEANKMYLLEE